MVKLNLKMKIALLRPRRNNYLVFQIVALIFSLSSCEGYSSKQTGIDSNKTESVPIRQSQDVSLDTNRLEHASYTIDTGYFSQFIRSVYRYDSTFGLLYSSTTKYSERNLGSSKLRVTTVQYSGHVISIQTTLFNDTDSIITKITVDGNEMKTFKDEDGLSIVPSFDLVYGKDLLVKEYELSNRKYLFLEGTDREAQGKYADILYGVLIDQMNRRVFLLQTYFIPGDFFFKKGASGGLIFLTSMPVNSMNGGVDSLKLLPKSI
jgi:hypothetical protein